MAGRIKRKIAQADPRLAAPASDTQAICPLCERPIPVAQRDAHHLLPRSRGGVETVWLHRICHRQIHALLSEAELEREYQTVDALQRHPGMARFLDWVQRKPDGFFERTRKSQRLRKR